MSLYPSLDDGPGASQEEFTDPPMTTQEEKGELLMGIPMENDEPPLGIPVKKDQEVLPEPKFRDNVAKELSTSVEAHTVVCALLLVTAVGCDCLAALDVPLGDTDAPSALRISSLVMIATAASPAIRGRRRQFNVIDQRVLLGSLLAVLSFLGKHHASETTRTGDCAYTVFVLLMTVQIYKAGGIESGSVRPDDVLNAPHRRQTVSGLCFSLMLYCGLRGFRMALHHADEVINYRIKYTIAGTQYTGQGYAFASTSVSIPLAMGNGMLICTSLVIGLHTQAYITGSSAVAFEVGSAGVAIAVACLWTLLGESDNFDNLPVLYGSGACSGTKDVCSEAYRARRFSITNGTSSGLWIASLACLVFSFAIERRLLQDVRTRAEDLWGKQGIGIGLLVVASAVAAVFSYYSSEGTMWYTDVCAMGCIIAVFLSAFVDTMLGSVIYLACMTYEEYMLYYYFGYDRMFVHLTHVSLVVSLAAMAFHLVLTMFKELVIFLGYDLKRDSIINTLMALSATVGTSLSFALYTASAILLAGSNGSLPEDKDTMRDGSGKRTMIAFALCHFVPFFAWMPLYVCRCEVQLIDSYTRAVAWLLSAPLDVLVYAVILSFMHQNAPSLDILDVPPSMVVGGSAVLAWVGASFV